MHQAVASIMRDRQAAPVEERCGSCTHKPIDVRAAGTVRDVGVRAVYSVRAAEAGA